MCSCQEDIILFLSILVTELLSSDYNTLKINDLSAECIGDCDYSSHRKLLEQQMLIHISIDHSIFKVKFLVKTDNHKHYLKE